MSLASKCFEALHPVGDIFEGSARAMPDQTRGQCNCIAAGIEAVPATPLSTPPCTPPPTPSSTQSCQQALPGFNYRQADHIGSAVVKLVTGLKLEGQFVEILRAGLRCQLDQERPPAFIAQETDDKITPFATAEAVGAARCAVTSLRAQALQASLGGQEAATDPIASPAQAPVKSRETVKGSGRAPEAVELPFPTFFARPASPAASSPHKAGDDCTGTTCFQESTSSHAKEVFAAVTEATRTRMADECQEEEAQHRKEEAEDAEASAEQHLGGKETKPEDQQLSSGSEPIQRHQADMASIWQMLVQKKAEKSARETQAMVSARKEKARSRGHAKVSADGAKEECSASQEVWRKLAADPYADINLPRSLSTWSQKRLLQMRSTLLPQTKQAMLSTLSETLTKLEHDRQKLQFVPGK